MSVERYPEKISAVVWDFDDTLVDSMDARVSALAQVFRDTDIGNIDPQHFLLNLREPTFGLALASLAQSLRRPPDLYDRYKSLYWTKEPGLLRLYPGVSDVLAMLTREEIPLAVVTQKSRHFQIDGVLAGVAVELEELGLAGLFPVVIGVDDVQETKPHPEGILMALERIGVQPENALMIGDTVTDIQAAKAAGCWSCLATWGVPDGASRAERSNPDMVVDTPGDLLKLRF